MPSERSLAGQLFSLLGLSGSGMPTDTVAPRSDNPANAEKIYRDFLGNTAVGNPNIWNVYNSTMSRPGSYDEMLRLWDEMTSWDLLSTAITELVDEVTQQDYGTGRSIWYECNDREVETDLNKMLDNIQAEDFLTSQVWFEAAMGNSFDKLHYEPGQGVLGMTWAHPMDVKRYWLAKNRRCLGFRWNGNVPNRDDLYFQGGQEVARVQIGEINNATEALWYPWDFLHIRRMYKMRVSEHGEPIFNEVQGIYKKLRMALDQMLVYRAQMQPDRYVVNIDTQEQPPIEQMKTLYRWKQQFRTKIAFGQGGQNGGYGPPTDFKAYYDAQALDTVLWMARPKGFQHGIEKMAGTANVPDIYDVELLTNLFFSAMRMPKSWLGIGDQTNGPQSGKALLAQDMRFLRAAKSIRKPIVAGYTWLGYLHCTLKNKPIESLNITAKMSDISSLEDSLRLELLDKQMQLLDRVGDVLEKFSIPKPAMVELMFKKYMHLPDDVVNAVITALPAQSSAEESSKSSPTVKAMIGLLEDKVSNTPEAQRLVFEIKQLNKYGPRRIEPPTGHSLIKGFALPTQKFEMKENDVIVSSYGEVEGMRKALLDPAAHSKSPINEAVPATRRWAPIEG